MIPPGTPLRVVGDVHGDARAFAHALATDRFVIQLGDLIDGGPDSPGALRAALEMRRRGRGLFLLGNHEFKLWCVLRGRKVKVPPALASTLAGMDDALRAEALAALEAAPAWLRLGRRLFVHAAYHPAMLAEPAPPPAERAQGPLARALYGQTTGQTHPDGFPDRSIRWTDEVPQGLTVYCGHDNRSPDGQPWRVTGACGGRVVFMDTGAGKGGHLAWIDLEEDAR